MKRINSSGIPKKIHSLSSFYCALH